MVSLPIHVYYLMALLVIFGVVFYIAVNLYVWFVVNGGRVVMFESDRKLHGKTVVITGGNAGVGKATATELAARGAKVIILCRDAARAGTAVTDIREKTNNDDVHFVECNLADFVSVRRAADSLIASEERIDILINNAGVFSGFSIHEVDGDLIANPSLPRTKQGFDSAFGINHLGHFLLTNLLLDLMKKSTPSRIVIVASVGHDEVTKPPDFTDSGKNGTKYPSLIGYHLSKLANVLHTIELARRLAGSGVTTYAANPGAVFSDVALRNRRMYNYSLPRALLTTYLAKPSMLTPTEGAQTILYCALDAGLESVSGKYYDRCKEARPSMYAEDDILAKRMWEESEQMVRQ